MLNQPVSKALEFCKEIPKIVKHEPGTMYLKFATGLKIASRSISNILEVRKAINAIPSEYYISTSATI